jgi:hypothetical protein
MYFVPKIPEGWHPETFEIGNYASAQSCRNPVYTGHVFRCIKNDAVPIANIPFVQIDFSPVRHVMARHYEKAI